MKKAELRNENLTKAIQGLTNKQLLEQYAKSYNPASPEHDICQDELTVRLGDWLNATWLPCNVMAVTPKHEPMPPIKLKVARG